MKKFLFLFILISFSNIGYSQIDITQDTIDLKSTHKFRNNIIDDIISDFVHRENFRNWKNRSKKMIVISSQKNSDDVFIIKVFPKIRENYSIHHLEDNYKAYINNKDYLIVFYGAIDSFLERKNNEILKLFPEKKIVKPDTDDSEIKMIVIDQPEIFGAEYLVKGNQIQLTEIRYFGSIE